MRRLSFIAMLVMICLFMSSLWAEENHYKKADRDLQRVFEHFEGISLENAITQLIAEKNADGIDSGDITDSAVIVEPLCKSTVYDKNDNPNLVYIPVDSFNFPEPPMDFEKEAGFITDEFGNKTISLKIYLNNEIQSYESNVNDLESIGVSVHKLPFTDRVVFGRFTFNLLPKICML